MTKPLVEVRLQMAGDDIVRQALSIAADRIEDMRPINELQRETLNKYGELRFRSRGAEGLKLHNVGGIKRVLDGQRIGPGWAGYDDEPKYAARKAGILGGTISLGAAAMPPLHWRVGRAGGEPRGNERLYPSFIGRGQWAVWKSNARGFEWGSSLPYAANHQFGRGRQKWDNKRIPKRQIIDGSDRRLVKQLTNNIHAYVESAFVGFEDSDGNVFKDSELSYTDKLSKTKVGGASATRVGLRGLTDLLRSNFRRGLN